MRWSDDNRGGDIASAAPIPLSGRRGFAYVLFLPVRRAKERPKIYLTLTFGLGSQKRSPRIDVSTEPYPGRLITC